MRAWRPAVAVAALALAGSGCTTIVRSSVASNGTAAAADSAIGPGLISDNGRYVAFDSDAANLVPGDTNGVPDVFRHDNVTGTTIRVSVDSSGGQIPGGTPFLTQAYAISGDGQHVAFRTDVALEPADTNNFADVYVRSVATGTTERVSIRPDGTPILSGTVQGGLEGIKDVSISDDGRFVLVLDVRPVSNHPPTIAGTAYLRDRATGTTTVVTEFAEEALLSGDATHVVANYVCTTLVCQQRSRVVSTADGTGEDIDTQCDFRAFDVSADARFVLGNRSDPFPDVNCPGPTGLVRWDRSTKTFRSVPTGATPFSQFAVSIANRGRFVAGLDFFGVVRVVDVKTGAIQIADTDTTGTRGSGQAIGAAISGNGRYVAVVSRSQLVPEDHDSIAQVFTRYSVRPTVSGAKPNSLARGAPHQLVTLTGTELIGRPAILISGSGITVNAATRTSTTSLQLDLSVDAGAPVGPRDVLVSNGGGFGHSDALCAACLSVT